jgi:hypothetical protein
VLTPDFEILNLTPFPKFIDFLNLIYEFLVSHTPLIFPAME